MVAQNTDEFLNDDFLEAAAKELSDFGFVTDEHDFAPYRETISEHISVIEDALNKRGNHYKLLSGYLNHPEAGYAYFIYDDDRFHDLDAAKRAVMAWLDKRYGEK